MFDHERLKIAMTELDGDSVSSILKQLMAEGGHEADKALEVCQEGMNEVGALFEAGEYFVGDLIFAGELMTQAVEIIKPAISAGSGGNLGKMILCTVADDLHDIGKNIVKAMLEAGGIEVVDLGIDTPPQKIVSAAKENGIAVIGLSGVLTLAIDSMKIVVEEFVKAGLRDKVKIIIGGAPVSEENCKLVAADAWAHNAAKSVEICRNWLGGEG